MPPKKAMAPSPRVILRDFDPDIQRRITFTAAVKAAFFDPQYTDENDAELAWVYSPPNEVKKREVKYGNNIAVLFKALYYCRGYHQWPQFWDAIAKGWKANGKVIEVVASILVRARSAYRDGPGRGRDACQTAKAVDNWIDFLKTPKAKESVHLSKTLLYQTAEEFYAEMSNKMVNAARIPPDGIERHPHRSNSGLPDKPPVRTGPASFRRAGLPEPPSPIKTESPGYDRDNLVRSSRKRSLSPSSGESPRTKRPNQTTLGTPRREEHVQQEERDEKPESAPGQASPPISPKVEVQIQESLPEQSECKRSNDETSPKPTNINESNTAPSPSTPSKSNAGDSSSERRAAIAGAIMHVEQSVSEIKGDMASFRGIMETVTDSVAQVVDHVDLLRKDVTELKQQGKDDALPKESMVKLETLMQKMAGDITSLKADIVALKIMSDAGNQKQEEYQQQDQAQATRTLQFIQETTTSIKTMMEEISELKCQQQLVPPPAPPVQLDDIKALMEGLFAQQEQKIQSQVEGLLAQQEKKIQSQVETLLVSHENKITSHIEGLFDQQEVNMKSQFTGFLGEQTGKIDTLKEEITKLKSEVISAISTIPAAAPAIPATPASKYGYPLTLKRVLTVADEDIKEHKDMLHKFYNKMNENGGGDLTRTSQMAGLLISLDEVLANIAHYIGPKER